MVATDGVYFTSFYPGLKLSNNLGDWSVEEHKRLCQFMPGLYWDDNTRRGDGRLKSRGVNAADLRACVRELDNKWIWFQERYTVGKHHKYKDLKKLIGKERVEELKKLWPSVDVPIAFGLVSAKLALHRNDWSQAGTIQTKPRVLTGNPSDKRNPDSVYVDDRGIIWTEPYDIAPDGIDSTPYSEKFGLELRDMITEDDVISQDGVVLDEFYEWIQDERKV
jgi:hypothetical protein